MSVVNQLQVQYIPSKNQLMVQGKKGPIAGVLVLDFSAAPTFHLDLQNDQSRGYIDLVQTIYIDNSAGGDQVVINISGSQQVIIAKAGTQGYYNVICPNPIVMDISSNGGQVAKFHFINVAIPGAVWSTN
jgi:hypothetical protein